MMNFYSSQIWGAPHHLKLFIEKREGDILTLSAKLFDAKGIQCVDGNQMIEFGLAGEGALIEHQGTSTGSSTIQLSNGRAFIKVRLNKGTSMVSVKSKGLVTDFLKVL